MRFLMFLVLVLLLCGSQARAGCKSDCLDEYQSEMESCKMTYDDSDDADDLRMCIDNAKSEYESCIEECEN
jgi:hypothetical protein